MRIRLLLFLLLTLVFFAPLISIAQEITVKRSSVVENYKGKPCYMHFVKQGETLTAIAKVYNISTDELRAENPALEKGLKADMVLRIPQKPVVLIPEAEAVRNEKPKEPVKSNDNADYYTYQVKKQETLYGISKQYSVTVDDIKNANPGLESLKEDMEIKIPKKKVVKDIVADVPAEKITKPEAKPDEIIVKTGETLYSISKELNITVDELIELNPELSGGLKAGMVLKINKTAVKEDKKSETDKNVSDVITTLIPSGCYNSKNIKRNYQVALLLPFLLENADTVLSASERNSTADFENYRYFQFYAGFMLAADSLQKYGLNARIQVLDADKLDDTLTIRQALRKPGLDKMDLMVGPVYASSSTIASRFAMKHEIGIVNPLSRREGIVNENPYVIKAQVSAIGISEKLASFINNNYSGANIIVVRNDKKELKSLADKFTLLFKDNISNHSFTGTLQESLFSTDLITGTAKKLKPGVKNIIVLFSNNKTAVPNFVSLLNPYSKSNDIILIGMDGWDELEIETEFLVNLNFHQVTSDYIDYESEAVQQFITQFRNKYGAVPLSSEHAFLGYDIGWYFLTSLMWYGDQYISCLPAHKINGLQNNFNFSADKKGDGLQNHDVNIIKVVDYKMVKVE